MSEPGSASAMTPAPTARSSEGGEPTAAGRFEAIIIVNPDALAPKTMRGISALCAAGAVVALITTGRVKDLVERTSLRRGLGTVLIAAAADTSCTIIDSWGTASVTRSGGADEDDGAGGALGWVLAELWKRGIGRRDALLVGHRAPLDRLEATTADVGDVVRDQLARRQRAEVPVARPDDLWAIMLGEPGIERVRVDASLVALADGVMGTSGALVTSGLGEPRWAVAGGAYIGDGPETRLVGAPLVMHLPYELAGRPQVRRVLDLHAGTLHEHVMTTRGELSAVRFSSLARPGTAVLRAACPDVPSASPTALPPGEDAVLDAGSDNGVHWMRVAGTPGGIAAAAADVRTTHEGATCVDRVAAYVASAEEIPSATEAVARCRTVTALGFDDLLAEHRAAWARRWADADVVIEGDDELQRALRFSLFHLMASVPDRGEAAVGARGLTGTGYRGHVFWDADTFTLPFLAATHPASARAMLEYRLGRLAAACAAARELGRRGARFPWESAHTGRDVTPTSARDRAGRTVAIRTGHLEEHIVAEVAFATCSYLDWSGDAEFAGGPGLDLLVETARYWASRVRDEPDGAHIYGVIGPDEYHEAVDDNAFTNVMARWNLRRAADALLGAAPGRASAEEAASWRHVADRLVDGYDAGTGVYEQFAGFHQLEPLVIAEVAPRRPIAADLLLGTARVHAAQVVKQADVLMLHHLVPDEVVPGSLEPNLRFYEPRTAHGSSLSPGVHASLFARAGWYERALDALAMAARVDLDDLTGTTAGGLHLAAMGTVWQALVFGFAGLRPHGDRLTIDPRLPASWAALEVTVRFHGSRVRTRVEHGRISVDTEGPVRVALDGEAYDVDGRLQLERRGHVWKEG